METQTCMDCGKPCPQGRRGLCPNDYAKRRRHGTLPPKKPGGPDAPCRASGCDRTVGTKGARGLCAMHYQRLTRTGSLDQPVKTAPLADRFRAKISTEPCPCGCNCELWIGGIHPITGYGNFSIGDKTYLAHRVAWQLEKGEIPEGAVLDHVYERGCRHRNCVKVAHLEIVNDLENNQRMPMTDVRRAGLSAAGHRGAAIRWARVRAGETIPDQNIGYRVFAVVSAHPEGVRASQVSVEADMTVNNARQGLVRLAKRGLIRGDGSGLYSPLLVE